MFFSVAAEAVRLSHRGSSGGRGGGNVDEDHEELVKTGAKACSLATPATCLETLGVEGRYCHWDPDMNDCFFSCDEFEDKYHKELGTSLQDCKTRSQCRVQNAQRDDCDPNEKFFKLHDVEDSKENIKTGRDACNAAEITDKASCIAHSSGVEANAGSSKTRMCHWSEATNDCFFSCDEFQGDLQDQCEKHEECKLVGNDCDPNAQFFAASINDTEDITATIEAATPKCAEKRSTSEADCIAVEPISGSGRRCHWDKKLRDCFYSCDEFEAKHASIRSEGGGLAGCTAHEECQVTGADDCDPKPEFARDNRSSL